MIYINGTASISPQPTLNEKEFLTDTREHKTNMLQCIEPDYNQFFHPNSLRRIGRVLRLGWAAAKSCLDDAGLDQPDSICVGTGKGCFKNTHDFLKSIDENDERFVPPSPFIQSAHGSIAAQIAIQTSCKNYNMTYSHRAFSFESGLMDAMMLLKERKFRNVLVGGVDEIEEVQFQTFNRLGHYIKSKVNNLSLIKDNSPGTIAGEGSTFFIVDNEKNDNTYAGIRSVHTFSKPENQRAIENEIISFIEHQKLDPAEIDLVLFGLNGDSKFDPIYYNFIDSLFANKQHAYYKHLCGEYHTSSAFALWIASKIIRLQEIPEIIRMNDTENKSINNILIYNHYRNINHALLLISKPE